MLYEADVLVMDQVRFVRANDFHIRDPAGKTLGTVETLGSATKRFFSGPREFVVYDGVQPSFKITDIFNFGRDQFEISTIDGRPLATVVKEFTLFGRRLTIDTADERQLTLTGSLMSREFSIDGVGGPIANVSRTFPSLLSKVAIRDHYIVSFLPGTPTPQRQVVIGSVLIIDLVRAKARK